MSPVLLSYAAPDAPITSFRLAFGGFVWDCACSVGNGGVFDVESSRATIICAMLVAAILPILMAPGARRIPGVEITSPTAKWEAELGILGGNCVLRVGIFC